MIKSYAITINGKVQGVFFRKFTKEKALEYRLNGFVQNLSNGSVYIEATGEENALESFSQWCHTGSPQSVVKEVTVKEIDIIHRDSFRIRYF
ncbi:MAG: acylphosphatase [Bacteroidetes bacterium]|nr:acylphosphatase [Bacteroidota bacterium]